MDKHKGQTPLWLRITGILSIAVASAGFMPQCGLDEAADVIRDYGDSDGDDSSGGWSPTEIGGLQLWLEANSSYLGFSAGNLVQDWADQSGFNRTFTQLGATNQPTYQTGILNGRPVVSFDGVDDVLERFSWTHAPPMSFVAVFSVNVDGVTDTVFDTRNAGGQGWAFMFTGAMDQFRPQYDTQYSTGYFASPGFHVYFISVSGTGSGSQYSIYVDGSATSIFDTTTAGPLPGLGSDSRIGRNYAGGDFMDGAIAELVIYDHVLSSGDRIQIMSHFSSKYGL